MQRMIDQRDKLSGKFTAKLFMVISIMAGDRFFQFEESQRLFFTKIWSFRMTNSKEELPKIKALAQLAGFA